MKLVSPCIGAPGSSSCKSLLCANCMLIRLHNCRSSNYGFLTLLLRLKLFILPKPCFIPGCMQRPCRRQQSHQEHARLLVNGPSVWHSLA